MVALASPGIPRYASCGSIPAHFRIRRRDARVPEIRCRESIRWIQLSVAGRTRWAAAGGAGAITKTPWPRNQDDAAGGLLESTPERRVLHHYLAVAPRPLRLASHPRLASASSPCRRACSEPGAATHGSRRGDPRTAEVLDQERHQRDR